MSNGTNESTRGPQIFNQSTDRVMKYYSVSQSELKELIRNSTNMAVSFSICTSVIWFGVDSFREYQLTGNAGALTWVFACVFIAVPFLIAGIRSTIHRIDIERDIRRGSPEKET